MCVIVSFHPVIAMPSTVLCVCFRMSISVPPLGQSGPDERVVRSSFLPSVHPFVASVTTLLNAIF